MKVKVTYQRVDGTSEDLVVTADARSTVAEVAERIHRLDPARAGGALHTVGRLTLATRLPGQDEPVVLPPTVPLGDAWIGSGAVVGLVDVDAGSRPDMRSGPVRAVLRILGTVTDVAAGQVQHGSDLDLRAGSYVVGRAADSDVVLNDLLVSKRHARIEVGDTIEVVDLGSANGVVNDGGAVQRLRVSEPEQFILGDTVLSIEPQSQGAAQGVVTRSGPVPFVRSPRVEPRYRGAEFATPDVPREEDKAPFNAIMLMAPILMGAAMFIIMQNPRMLVFVLMSPLMMVGNWWNQRRTSKRKQVRSVERFLAHLSGLSGSLAAEAITEKRARLQEATATPLALAEAMRRGPLLWTRRPEHWSFLNVRLGLATMPTRCTVERPIKGELIAEHEEALDELIDRYKDVPDVPVTENLFDAGAVGLAGEVSRVSRSLDALLVQLTALHSPAELVVTSLVSATWSQQLEWLKWMPHTSSPHSPVDGPHLADSASSIGTLLSRLEELIAARAQGKASARGAIKEDAGALDRGAVVGHEDSAGTRSLVPAVVVVISVGVDADMSRLAQISEIGPDAGVFPIWVAPSTADLPAACRTFLSYDEQGRVSVGLVRLGRLVTDVTPDVVDPAQVVAYARRMAPVFDAGAVVEDSSDLPRSISTVTLLGAEMFSQPDAVVDRWHENQSIIPAGGFPAGTRRRAGSLRAVVGSAGVDPLQIDLRSQGPHALVGGTTGAGKSEFLQAWVLGLAAAYSPQRVTFLFVDYKGGSAFADCVELPHCVGLVTDLSPHLVRRALTSLRAELHHRELLFNRKKAKDLLALEKAGDPEAPPALVLVFDEFAALVNDVPEFVDGVVDIAQRGRSLGIHLVMATQRPAGVIKDNLRANTNLRIALRMADESDSTDVLGVPDAAHVDPGTPGRGVVKSGPGRLHPFQSGYAGGWTSERVEKAGIVVAQLRFGSEVVWEEPADEAAPVVPAEEDLGPNDQQRLVKTIVEANRYAAIAPARRPWLDELATAYDLALLRQRTDTDLVIGVGDRPEVQAQVPTYFRPDVDGHLGVYGTGGTGKSTVLRTLAAAAGITPRGGPVHVYGLDFSSGGLRMLEDLPHVGAVISGDDVDRVARLWRTVRGEMERRSALFAPYSASSIVDYRERSGERELPRLLILVDGYPQFRDDFETGAGRAVWYDVFRSVLMEGRGLGIHVVLSADRPGSVPTSVRSGLQRHVILRLADDSYRLLDAPDDVLTAASPPGRAVVDGYETQVAVVGGHRAVADQVRATQALGASMLRAGVRPAPEIGALPTEYSPDLLPDSLGGRPVLGLSDIDLGPVAWDPDGTLLLGGAPGSGRTNAAVAIVRSLLRAEPDARCYLVADRRSPLHGALPWTDVATSPEAAVVLAGDLTAAVSDEDTEGRIIILVESMNEYLQGPADRALVDLIKAVKKSAHTFIADADIASWGPTWPLLAEVKGARRGFLLQPDPAEGEVLLRTALPRVQRSEMPAGRGFYVARGQFVRVQLPWVLGEPLG